MLWKRFLLSRALIRWTTCAALIVGADLALTSFSNSRLAAQEKKEKVQPAKKKSADELRKELEEKLKGVDLNDPKFDELTKEYEKLIKEAIGQTPQVPVPQNGPFIIGPAQVVDRQGIDELRKRMQQQGRLEGGLLFPNFPNLPPRGRLGITIEALPEELREQLDIPNNRGQLIREVMPGSVAEKIGLKTNDVVLEFDGKPVPGDTQDFVKMVLDHKADVETSIVFIRKGKKETIKGIKLPEIKAELPKGQFNLGGALIQEVEKIVKEELLIDAIPVDLPEIGIQNGTFNLSSTRDGIQLQVTGTIDGKNKEIKSIKIKDGDTSVEINDLEKLPEKYKAQVEKLMKSVK